MHRVVLEIAQGVVHPAHVPLVREPEPAELDGVSDLRPGSAFLSDDHCGGHLVGNCRGQLAQERNRVQVLATAVAVRHPAPCGPRVVEVEHAGNGINAQPVDVELVQPIQRVGNKEVADLGAPVVEDVGTPVGVLALAGVGMFVEGGAIEAGEAPLVLREVRGHPVDDHADAAAVENIDHRPQLVGCAVARSWRVVATDLVAPRATERMLGDRQQLDVGEAERDHMVGQLRAELDVIVHARTPRSDVRLVDT